MGTTWLRDSHDSLVIRIQEAGVLFESKQVVSHFGGELTVARLGCGLLTLSSSSCFFARNFELPWLDERSRCRLEIQKKQTPHRTCRK